MGTRVYGYPDALVELRPGAEWTLHDSSDYSTLVWISNDSTAPNLEEVEAKLEEIRQRPVEE
jgi:hypothetical protein